MSDEETAMAKIARLASRDPEVEIERLCAALEGLVNRLDAIHHDPRYESVWASYMIHGGRYNGPTYVEELARAREALAGDMTGPMKSG